MSYTGRDTAASSSSTPADARRTSYELQVLQGARRTGLGKRLMHHLVSIAKGWKMQKIMLTVLKCASLLQRNPQFTSRIS